MCRIVRNFNNYKTDDDSRPAKLELIAEDFRLRVGVDDSLSLYTAVDASEGEYVASAFKTLRSEHLGSGLQ